MKKTSTRLADGREPLYGDSRDDAVREPWTTARSTPSPPKPKSLAGSESGMGVFINDVPPETAARRLREAART